MAADSPESPVDSMGLVVMPGPEAVEPVDVEPEIAQGGGEAPALMPEAMVVVSVSTVSNRKQTPRIWDKATQPNNWCPTIFLNVIHCETNIEKRFVTSILEYV